ncbi:MAG TPA: hypothetical protein VJ550_15530 [Geomonas sp.]|nr:hypothetical protein [Geomonas sp.]
MKKIWALSMLPMLLATPAFADNAADQPAGGVNFNLKGISVNFGGFLEGATLYRSRNLNSDIASPIQKLPLANSAGYYQDETRFSARQSRLSLLVRGDYSPTTHLAGYYEMDFLGAAPTANYNESTSFNPRVRHLYTTIDWDRLGLHVLGGQTWSLATMNNKGITPRNEAPPLTIEAQYIPGFTWARQPQFRVVKDWDKKYWLAVSVENAQTTAASTPNAPSNTNLALNQPAGLLLSSPVSVNDRPDIVVKAAWEPSFGHFEVYDLVRGFRSDIAENGSIHHQNTTTNAVGGGMIVPVLNNKVTLTASALYGKGIGRYGSAQLPDVTQDPNGNLQPLTELQYLAGVTYSPSSDWDFYAYYGAEQVQQKDWVSGGKGYGYGSPLYNNTGFSTFGSAANTVQGQVKRVSQIAVGDWWKFYQGSFGKMQTGLEYSYTTDQYFDGIGGAPSAHDHIAMASLRYYWQ